VRAEKPREEASSGRECGAIGDERGKEEPGDVRGEEVVAAAVHGASGIGGEDMLEETLGGRGRERDREGRERGGEAAAAETTE